jgi:hypothetical protein
MFPALESGDTIRATYMLQASPFVAILAAGAVAGLRARWPHVPRWIAFALLLVGIHNLGLCLTRHCRVL